MCRLLETVSTSGAAASPMERPVMEGALNLAIRLGLPTSALLDKVLDARAGAAFYENFRKSVSALRACVDVAVLPAASLSLMLSKHLHAVWEAHLLEKLWGSCLVPRFSLIFWYVAISLTGSVCTM